MPLPVGHTLSGYLIYDSLSTEGSHFSWKELLLFVIVVNIPDADFLPGYLTGEPNKYHHHYLSHSLGAAIIFGAFAASFYYFKGRQQIISKFLLFSGLYFSHVLLDAFSADYSEPYGVPMFWPITEQYLYSPVSVFLAVHKSDSSGSFLKSLLVLHNFWAILWEGVIFMPLILLSKWIKKYRGTKATRASQI